jgi:hypothetical protein
MPSTKPQQGIRFSSIGGSFRMPYFDRSRSPNKHHQTNTYVNDTRGRCLIDGKHVFVILNDANHNGLYEEGDRWSLNAAGTAADGSTSREIGERYWFRNAGYRLELERSTGQYAKLIKIASRGSGYSSRAEQKVVSNGTPWRVSRALFY